MMKKQDVHTMYLTSLCRLCFEMTLCFHLHAGDKVGHLKHSRTDLESSLEKSPILREVVGRYLTYICMYQVHNMWETALCGKKEVFHMEGSSKYMMMITTIISIMVFPQVGPKAHLYRFNFFIYIPSRRQRCLTVEQNHLLISWF